VPAGVELRDAAKILPQSAVVQHRKSGSPALFSDRFRYALLRQAPAIWVDSDMYFVRPLSPERDHIVGEQEAGVANGAVLKLLPDTPVLADLNALFEAPGTPFWLSRREKAKAMLRRRLGLPAGLAAMPWGTAGPHALTALLKRHGLWHVVLPRDVFYPAGWREAEWLVDPGKDLSDFVTPDTIAVHLWASRVTYLLRQSPARGSFLERLLAEGSE
jgi:hypothetical protein